jgi:copper oxidase (laccase) domain-containing protein
VAGPALECFGAAVLRPGDAGGRPSFDLWSANQLALLGAGLAPEHVQLAGLCTRCHNDQFFSHRGEGPRRGLFALIAGFV